MERAGRVTGARVFDSVGEDQRPDAGSAHLKWILRFQLGLLPLGAVAWLLRGRWAALAFLAGALGSIAFWTFHVFVVSRTLTPSVRRRWFFALLGLGKLALIVALLRGMMACLPGEGIPLVSGILLFVLAILLEAARLVLRPGSEDLS